MSGERASGKRRARKRRAPQRRACKRQAQSALTASPPVVRGRAASALALAPALFARGLRCVPGRLLSGLGGGRPRCWLCGALPRAFCMWRLCRTASGRRAIFSATHGLWPHGRRFLRTHRHRHRGSLELRLARPLWIGRYAGRATRLRRRGCRRRWRRRHCDWGGRRRGHGGARSLRQHRGRRRCRYDRRRSGLNCSAGRHTAIVIKEKADGRAVGRCE